jgi:fructose/tagatose bisphosphate aldolase
MMAICWKIEKEGGGPTICNTEFQTDKARMAYAFADHMILAAMQGHGIGMAMHQDHGHPHETAPNPPVVDLIAKQACDLAEVLWAEMKRREFVVEFPIPPGWAPIEE